MEWYLAGIPCAVESQTRARGRLSPVVERGGYSYLYANT